LFIFILYINLNTQHSASTDSEPETILSAADIYLGFRFSSDISGAQRRHSALEINSPAFDARPRGKTGKPSITHHQEETNKLDIKRAKEGKQKTIKGF